MHIFYIILWLGVRLNMQNESAMTLQSLDLDICIWWSLSRSCLRNSSSLWTCNSLNEPFLLVSSDSHGSSHWVNQSIFYFLTRVCDHTHIDLPTQIHYTRLYTSHSCATMRCTHQRKHLSNRLISSFSLCSPVLLNPFVHILPETLAASPSWPAAFVSCTRCPLQSMTMFSQCFTFCHRGIRRPGSARAAILLGSIHPN